MKDKSLIDPEKYFDPDFLIIPHPLYTCRDLSQFDCFVYGIIYWFHSMRDGVCRASNQTIANIIGGNARSVQRSIVKLELQGFIARTMTETGDDRELEPLVNFRRPMTKVSGGGTTPVSWGGDVDVVGGRPTGRTIENNDKEDLTREVYEYFQNKIYPKSKLTPGGKDKIKTRLKSYSFDELKEAMDAFSASPWWMKHNAHRGIAWFFKSDDQIDRFINLIEETKQNGVLFIS